MISTYFLIYFLFCVQVATLEEANVDDFKETTREPHAPGCKSLLQHEMYGECKGVSKALLANFNYFEDEIVGSEESFEIDTLIMHELCRRYSSCPLTNHWACFLPRLHAEKDFVCPRIAFLRSPLATCLKKFLKEQPADENLKEFVKGVDKDGMNAKCKFLGGDLWFYRELREAVVIECGNTAAKSLDHHKYNLHSFYRCRT